MTYNTPSVQRLQELLAYCPLTGLMHWRGTLNPAMARRHPKGYMTGFIEDRQFLAHRVAWALWYGEWPNSDVDHINHNKADNSISNLRLVNNQENHKNKPKSKRNKSGVTGVYWDARIKKYTASIRADGYLWYLGSFDSIEDAAWARSEAEYSLDYHPNHGA